MITIARIVATVVVISALSVARPAAASADTCLGVPCPAGVSRVIGGAPDVIPGLGAASAVINTVTGAVGSAVGSVAQGMLDQIGRGIADSVGSLFAQVSAFLTASSSPQVTAASFVSGDGAYHQVADLAAITMVLFMFLAVVGGALSGDTTTVLARMFRTLPLAVLAIIGFPWAVDELLRLVDAVCASLLPTGATLTTIAGVYAADQVHAIGGFGLPAILTELFVFLGGMAIYAELVVRAALVTVVVALAPLSFAAMVWPAARGAARKVVELVCAIVLSKLAIWVALAVGISLFKTQAATGAPGGQAWGQMISGAAIISVAVFAPFVVWRLLPVAEAAIVAQGLARMPGRAALNTAQTANTLGGRGARRAGPGSDDAQHPALDLPARSLADPAGAGGAPGAEGPTAAGAGGSSVAAGPVAAAVGTATAVKDHVVAAADQHTQSATPAHGGWSFRPPGGEEHP